MPLPLTNIDKVVAMRPELRQFFEGGKKIIGFQPMPTTPQPRVLVLRGLKEQVVYPMWNNIDEVMRVNGKEYARFEGVIILGGIGLGYLAEAIASKIGPFCTLAIWEPDPEWIRVACYFRKNDALFANSQVQLLIGGEQVLRTYIDMTYQRLSLGIQTVVDSCLGDMYPERREMMDVTIPAIMKTYEGNRSTLIAFGELFFKNAIRSLEFMAESHSVSTLKGVAQGIPAIVVGAGPELSKNKYRHLKRLKRRPASCLVFSADTALAPLLAHGIVPDFVFSVDPQPETGVKYKNLQIPKECALIFHPGACSEIAETFPHLKFYVPSPITPLDQFESIFGKSEGIGAKMQCQVHLACDVATYMGCTPIMLVGIDLCYYSPQELYAELPSYLEGLEQEHFDKAVPEKDMNGDEVFVTSQFDQYRAGFAERAKTIRLLNGNERGLIIPGVKKKTLSQFIAQETGMRLIDMVSVKQKIVRDGIEDATHVLKTKIRSICKELRFYQLVATQVNKYVEKGDGLETRDLLSRWCWKVCRRKEGLIVLVLLERYGHMWPEPIRQIRMPVLADQLASVTEWVRMAEYYNWLLRATTLALNEFEAVYAHLARTRVPKVRALVSVSDGTDPE